LHIKRSITGWRAELRGDFKRIVVSGYETYRIVGSSIVEIEFVELQTVGTVKGNL